MQAWHGEVDGATTYIVKAQGKMRQMITNLLNQRWKTWSTQAAKLQLLKADHENKKKQGHAFFKMDEAIIITVRVKLANNIYELTTHHKEEIKATLSLKWTKRT